MDTAIQTILASQEFAEFVQLVVLTTVTTVIAFVGKAAHTFIGDKNNTQLFEQLTLIARVGVMAAEQTGLDKTGADKKAEAIKYIQATLDSMKIKVSAEQIEAAIEAVVYAEFTQFKADADDEVPATV